MKIEFFRYLPPEIIIEILSRLPIRTIVRCKRVCRSWRDLIQAREFADSHLSKSSSGVVTCGYCRCFEIFEFVDELNLEHHHLHYSRVTEFNCDKFISRSVIIGSANGLLFLQALRSQSCEKVLYICNPVTREYIHLPNPDTDTCIQHSHISVTYGFGVSKMTAQHKLVRILHDPWTHIRATGTMYVCQVYTLETGSWRSISRSAEFGHNSNSNNSSVGTSLNGSLHWLVDDSKGSHWISCFDLETEHFSRFSLPPLPEKERRVWVLAALGDYLCICDSVSASDNDIDIWLMKKYGDGRSWTKEFVVRKLPLNCCEPYANVYPIKLFKDGDILMVWGDFHLLYYSNKTENTQEMDLFGMYDDGGGLDAMLHTSSFLSLRNFPLDNLPHY